MLRVYLQNYLMTTISLTFDSWHASIEVVFFVGFFFKRVPAYINLV